MPTESRMTDDTLIDPDPVNDAGIRVREDGGCYIISFLAFEGGPMSVQMKIPKRGAVTSLRRYFRTLQETEDVYVALLQDYMAKQGLNGVRPPRRSPSRKPLTLPRGRLHDDPPF